jgi:hypothetical protein
MERSLNSSLSCLPRFATPRRAERETFGPRLAKIADLLGQPLMPWQRYVADVGCELDPETGLPAYREVMVTVPRQSGKTTLFLSWQLDRCLNWGRPQRSVFTAQTGKDARDKWVDELFPLVEHSKLAPLVRGKANVGMGNESVTFKTGSRIRLLSTSASSGHSKTLHQAVLDEIWHDEDDRREQGLRPALITVPDAQLLVCSTAGTQASTVMNRKVQAGRLAVAEDSGLGVAYFEWSAPDDWDPTDEESWWEFMPALGHTIGPEQIRPELQSLPRAEFIRAYGNRPTGGADLVIPSEVWRRVCDPVAKPSDPVRFGLDVSQDRSSSAIVAYGANHHVELVEHRPGTGWVAARANELTAEHKSTIALDFGGPAGVLADSLERCKRLQGRDVVQACGAMYDAIVEATVTFRTDPALDSAVDGVVKKPVGDQWVWSRKASMSDVTPLMAATIARGSQPPGGNILVAWR